MKTFPVLIATVAASAVTLTFAAEKKPLPPLPPSKSVKDLAIEEARKFDTDHNNKIESLEIFALRDEFKNNANSHLYIFDENSNHYLDDDEIAKIPLAPKKEKAKPKPAAPGGKPTPTTHPHGAPHT
jgi:hypothetical protein